jgi:acyl dehydratase
MTAEVPEEGDVFTHTRTFTTDEVRQFGEITGDEQAIHTEPDEQGRLVVQGLLTGSLMTKIGGDLAYTAQTMEYGFQRPVYTGETITCEWTVVSREDRDDRHVLENDVVYTNGADEVVVDAATHGLIWRE